MKRGFFQTTHKRLHFIKMGKARFAAVFKSALCSSVVLAFSATVSTAQTYPARPVRMIVANGPGAAPDVIARLLGAKLGESWGQNVVIDNRPGATGLIAAELLARSAPDGHTLFLSTMTQLIGTLMYQRYMLATEFAPVTLVGTTPFAIVVSSALPVKSISEWIAYAKARPGQLLYGSGGQWGSSHLCIEKINVELVKTLKNPELHERMYTVGAEAVGSTPAEFAAFLKKDTDHWTKVLRESGATLGK